MFSAFKAIYIDAEVYTDRPNHIFITKFKIFFIFLFFLIGILELRFDIIIKSVAEEEGQNGYLGPLSDPSMKEFFTKKFEKRWGEGE